MSEPIIGKQGYGELNISGGARVNVTGAQGSVVTSQFDRNPETAGIQSRLVIRGAGSQLNVNGPMTIGLGESSVMIVESGGLLTTGSATVVTVEKFTFTETRLGSQVYIDGAGSRWENAGDLSLGVVSDQRTGNVGLVLSDGGTVATGGVLTNFGVLEGANGTIEGNVINHHRIFVGRSNFFPQNFGLFHITGDYEQRGVSFNHQGSLNIEGITAASPSKLRVDGNVTLNSLFSDLTVRGTGDPLLDQYDLGDAFDIFDFNGAVTGSFKMINLPPLNSSLKWNTSELYTTGVIRVVRYYAADFDEDGDVDQTDYNIWKGAYGVNKLGDANGDNLTDAADWTIWRDTLGSTSSAAVVNGAAVPEPAAMLVLLALLPLIRRRS